MAAVITPDAAREEAFIRLVDTYQTPLRRMCCAILRDRQQAEDAVQDTFLKAYRSMGSFRGESSEKTWLMRIAINTCRDFRRSAWFRHLDRRVTPEELPLVASPPADERAELADAILRLPLALREVTLLHYYQSMTTREIARALKVPQSTVSVRLKRARERLREYLERGEPV